MARRGRHGDRNPEQGLKGLGTDSGRYKVSGIPESVVIEKRGRIRLIIIGSDPASKARLNKW